LRTPNLAIIQNMMLQWQKTHSPTQSLEKIGTGKVAFVYGHDGTSLPRQADRKAHLTSKQNNANGARKRT